MALLFVRYTGLPPALGILGISAIFLSDQVGRGLFGNPWWIFWPQLTMIGKNDIFLAASLLAIILFIPSSKNGPFFPFGLALASAVAISIKPNSALLILFAWLTFGFYLWRSGKTRQYSRQIILGALAMSPAVLWMLRNMIIQGRLIGEQALLISKWSIASNLTNPFLYNNSPNQFYGVIAVIVISTIISIFRPALRHYCLISFILFITFILTPASAFFGSTQQLTQFEWRFAIGLLAYIFLLFMVILEPLILSIYGRVIKRAWLAIPLALAVLVLSAWIIWTQRDLLSTNPEKAIVLRDQYTASVGVDGYYSSYDYVRKNVHDSVVIVENGLPFYLYDAALTNSVTRSRPADYLVYLQTPWLGEGGYPDMLSQPEWSQNWQIVYEDPEGRVYQRK